VQLKFSATEKLAVAFLLGRGQVEGVARGVNRTLPFRVGNESPGRLLPKERSVSYIVLAVMSVAFVRLAIVCVYPRRTIAADDLESVE